MVNDSKIAQEGEAAERLNKELIQKKEKYDKGDSQVDAKKESEKEEEERYLQEALAAGKQEWGRSKIMLVGAGRAGKTALANSILGRAYEDTDSTRGINEFTCSIGHAAISSTFSPAIAAKETLWSEYREQKQRRELETAVARLVFEKKSGAGNEKKKRNDSSEAGEELLMMMKKTGGYVEEEREREEEEAEAEEEEEETGEAQNKKKLPERQSVRRKTKEKKIGKTKYLTPSPPLPDHERKPSSSNPRLSRPNKEKEKKEESSSSSLVTAERALDSSLVISISRREGLCGEQADRLSL